MDIQEVKDKHCFIADNSFFKSYIEDHTKLSIEFAISVLEDLRMYVCDIDRDPINDKIQELKQYLETKNSEK